MPVDPQVRTFLDGFEDTTEPISTSSPAEAREVMKLAALLARAPEAPAPTSDRTVPGRGGDIPVRVYRPDAEGPLPVVVYFHGGGFVIGGIESHDPLCQQLATRVPAVVVSVEYRLAPEHRFPAAVDDAFDALRWVSANAAALGGDAARLAVAGDSAGGNLSAVVSLLARDAGGPPVAFQLLIYPATDLTMSTPSHRLNGEGYLLTREEMDWFMGHYLPDDVDRRLPTLSPLFADDLSGLPPALVVTAEFDPLRDEGEAYGARLEEAGVEARVARYDGMIHGFVSLDAIVDGGARAIDECVSALQEALS
ncbi:MAG TPA: alpha/beta hydrolase [Acidimicrobiales bacterium]|nr:alpha/beta hydrolase [Acidimicrobiales bacterium]